MIHKIRGQSPQNDQATAGRPMENLMPRNTTRRSVLRAAAGGGLGLAAGQLGFLAALPRLSAEEVRLDPAAVRFQPEIEPLVRLLERTPRERLLEEVAARLRGGLSYRELLAALMLAGVRNIQPRPHVGFRFHAVMVVNSAHLASLSSPEKDRWLPIFWALDYFKSAQSRDEREGNWTLAPVEEQAVPPAHKARQAFIDALENWDEAAADVAIAGLARTAGANEVYELLFRYGGRDFRSIGHKAIYAANSFRTLQCIGWQHAEPVLRSLAYALLATEGQDPKTGEAPADRPWRQNQELVKQIRDDWLAGRPDPAASGELLTALREASSEDASSQVVELLNRGISPYSVWDGLFSGAGELLMRRPGIIALHAATSMNAMHFAFQMVSRDQTRRLLCLQAAAFLTLFREILRAREGIALDTLEPLAPEGDAPEAVEAIFSDVRRDNLAAARKTLGYLQAQGDSQTFADAARRLVFLKGDNSHDYKFSSAVLEDYYQLAPAWRDRYLAASVFALRGSSERDSALSARTRAALDG
jgi:hypothetical protein